ncbi:hypothetical protein Plhal304r1_c025g0085651 [Plasmopara halstedii]
MLCILSGQGSSEKITSLEWLVRPVDGQDHVMSHLVRNQSLIPIQYFASLKYQSYIPHEKHSSLCIEGATFCARFAFEFERRVCELRGKRLRTLKFKITTRYASDSAAGLP